LGNQKSVLTVSTYLDGEYDLRDVCLSLPVIVSRNGIERIIESELPEKERASLKNSARILKQTIEDLKKASLAR
jgi:L-lactate dehydrogenase